jgi:nucleotide-binding universal stress UspA family protein
LVVVRAHLPTNDGLWTEDRYPARSPQEHARLERETAQAELDASVSRLRRPDLIVEAHFGEGAPADVILETAASERADLIVMSTHGHGGFGRWLYGSVADEVLCRATVPVLLVAAAVTRRWSADDPRCIVVALDACELAAHALRPAAEVAAMLEAKMVLLRVVEPLAVLYAEVVMQLEREQAEARAYLDGVAAELHTLNPMASPVAVRVARGNAVPTIAQVANALHADAIVMSSHGRGGVARLVLGSVTTGVLQRSDMPLLVCPASTATQFDQQPPVREQITTS